MLVEVFGVEVQPVDEHLDGVIILAGGGHRLGMIEEPLDFLAVFFGNVTIPSGTIGKLPAGVLVLFTVIRVLSYTEIYVLHIGTVNNSIGCIHFIINNRRANHDGISLRWTNHSRLFTTPIPVSRNPAPALATSARRSEN